LAHRASSKQNLPGYAIQCLNQAISSVTRIPTFFVPLMIRRL